MKVILFISHYTGGCKTYKKTLVEKVKPLTFSVKRKIMHSRKQKYAMCTTVRCTKNFASCSGWFASLSHTFFVAIILRPMEIEFRRNIHKYIREYLLVIHSRNDRGQFVNHVHKCRYMYRATTWLLSLIHDQISLAITSNDRTQRRPSSRGRCR